MQRTVLGIFEDGDYAEALIEQLDREGYDPKDISIVMRDKKESAEMGERTGTGVAEETASGAVSGAVVGGLAGLLASIAIPGIGGLLVGGPLAAALGLTGAAATAATGAITGSIAGGLIGALMGIGVPREEAERYEEFIKGGAVLVAVPTQGMEHVEVEGLFREHGATEVKTLSHEKEKDVRTTDRPSHLSFASKGGKSRRTRR